MGQQIKLEWLGGWVALVASTALAAEGVHFANPDADPGTLQVTLALCGSWLAVLLQPAGPGHVAAPGHVLLWSGMAAAGFLLLSLLPPYAVTGAVSLRLAGGVAVLVLLFSAVQALLRQHTSSRATSMTLFTLLAAIFLAAPLYLGVVAEGFAGRTSVADAIIAASPASYFAGIAGFDYLRSTWFYQHTPFGGLRFNYPDPGFMTVCYLFIALALFSAKALKNKPQDRSSTP